MEDASLYAINQKDSDADGFLPWSEPSPWLSRGWSSGLVMFSCQLFLLFANSGSRLWIVAFIAISGLWLIKHGQNNVNALQRNAIIFCIPLFYLFSSTWSMYPIKTLYSDAELAATLILAIVIVAAPDRRAAITGLSLAYAIYTLISVVFGKSVPWESEGMTAFSGLGGGKNYFGHTSAVTAIMSISLLFWAVDKKCSTYVRLFSIFGFFCIYALSVHAVLISRASGSLIALGLATFAFLAALVAGRSRGGIRFMIFFAALSVMLLFILFGDAIKESLTGAIMQTFHKTPDLSGRRFLWATADKIIQDNPFLGIGYQAFWTPGNPAAEGIWAMYLIPGKSGYNFHNTLREMRVEGGLVGAGILISTYLYLIAAQFTRALFRRDAIEALGFALLIYFISRILTESLAFGIWSSDAVLLLFFLALPARQDTIGGH